MQLCQVLGSTQPLCMHLGWPDPPLGVTAGSAQLQASSANSWNHVKFILVLAINQDN